MRSVDVHIDVQEIWFDPMHVRHYDSGWRTIDVSMVAQQIVERDGTFDDVWNDTSRDGKPYEQPALPGMSKELPS